MSSAVSPIRADSVWPCRIGKDTKLRQWRGGGNTRTPAALGILLDQSLILRKFGLRRIAVLGGRGRPRQLLVRPYLDVRREPAMVVEHRRTQIDKCVHALWTREHPAHAIGAEIVARRAMQAAD